MMHPLLSLASLCLLMTLCCGIKLGDPMKNNPDRFTTPAPVTMDQTKPSTSRKFQFHSQLDDNYDLYWDVNKTHITFETIVKTNGYVALGISDNGAMAPADIVVGWVKDGQTHLSDRFSSGYFMPAKDTVQDWILLEGLEQGAYTRLTMVRALDTCDSQDKPIKEGTTRLIYAYNPADPDSDDAIGYHGSSSRGTKSVFLLDPSSTDKKPAQMPDDVITYDFLNYNYSVPSADTTYRCTIWKLPKLDGKHHLIRYEPVITKGHEKLLHHIILYYCSGHVPDTSVGTEFDCYYVRTPQAVDSCEHIFVAWAIGGQSFDYPQVAGQSLGTSDDPGYFKMETHYDNSGMRDDLIDNSGIRIFLTKQLRQHDAGFLEIGVNIDKYQIIPPKNPEFLSTGHCHPSCTQEGFNGQDINVFSNVLHSHLIGAKMRTRHYRNGVELEPIAIDNGYDFNFQEQRYLEKERVVKPGDYLKVDCVYDSTKRDGLTFGGLSSREEMCLSFLVYYPRVPMSICRSRVMYKVLENSDPQQWVQTLTMWDWTQQKHQDTFKQWVDEAPIMNVCIGSSKRISVYGVTTPVPKITSNRNVTDVCTS